MVFSLLPPAQGLGKTFQVSAFLAGLFGGGAIKRRAFPCLSSSSLSRSSLSHPPLIPPSHALAYTLLFLSLKCSLFDSALVC